MNRIKVNARRQNAKSVSVPPSRLQLTPLRFCWSAVRKGVALCMIALAAWGFRSVAIPSCPSLLRQHLKDNNGVSNLTHSVGWGEAWAEDGNNKSISLQCRSGASQLGHNIPFLLWLLVRQHTSLLHSVVPSSLAPLLQFKQQNCITCYLYMSWKNMSLVHTVPIYSDTRPYPCRRLNAHVSFNMPCTCFAPPMSIDTSTINIYHKPILAFRSFVTQGYNSPHEVKTSVICYVGHFKVWCSSPFFS